MSYILNALRKSEQERQAHSPTLPSAIYQEQAGENRRGIWLIVALIVINLATLIFFIRMSAMNSDGEAPGISARETHSGKETAVRSLSPPVGMGKNQTPPEVVSAHSAMAHGNNPQPAAEQRQFSISRVVDARRFRSAVPGAKPAMAARQNKTVSLTGPAKHPAAGNKTIPAPSVPSPLDDPLKRASEKVPARAEGRQPLPGRRIAAVSSKLQPPPLPAKEKAATVGVRKPAAVEGSGTGARPRVKPPGKSKVGNDKTAQLRSTPVRRNTPRKQPAVPLLSELPLEFRRQVPKLNINVFVYADQSPQRFVIVDMVKYRAGQNIQNMRLKEILADSLVVEYMGKTFRIRRP
ncbi:general secretion pathway protein GspB [Thiolapillus sp.]|uniref:general secretion pathway protein GspB n=1 Tax=Thiolapillus sp. TaxID=2017437 RepID=UPI003AF9684E